MFVGYCTNSKAYRLYNPITCKVITSRDVVFNENIGNIGWSWENGLETTPMMLYEDSTNLAELAEIHFASRSTDVVSSENERCYTFRC